MNKSAVKFQGGIKRGISGDLSKGNFKIYSSIPKNNIIPPVAVP